MSAALAIGLLFAVACGGNRRGPVDAPPAWQSAEGRVSARIEMAEALVTSGSTNAALAMISQMRSEGFSDVRLDLVQARALRDTGLTDDAQSLLQDVIKKHPRNAEAHDQLGIICLDDQRVDAAVLHLERAARLSPEDPEVLNNLGFALMAAGDPERAAVVLRDALRLNASSSKIRNNLGFALVSANRDSEALRVFRAGLPDADARYNLGLGQELRGDADAAVDQYAGVLVDWPGHRPSIAGLRRLRSGELHMISPPSKDSPTEVP